MYIYAIASISAVLLIVMLARLLAATSWPQLAVSAQVVPAFACAGLAAIWALLSSTLFLWVVPLSLLASVAIGYYGAKSLKRICSLKELRLAVPTTALSVGAAALTVGFTADPAYQLIAGPYVAANGVLLLLGSWPNLRAQGNAA